jgi:hypothetical protein
VLGARAGAWLFWVTAAILAVAIAGSVYWLLTRAAS